MKNPILEAGMILVDNFDDPWLVVNTLNGLYVVSSCGKGNISIKMEDINEDYTIDQSMFWFIEVRGLPTDGLDYMSLETREVLWKMDELVTTPSIQELSNDEMEETFTRAKKFVESFVDSIIKLLEDDDEE